MLKRIGFAFLVTTSLLVLALLPGTALAGTILPGTYRLLDHGDGNLGPDYGLRLDSLGALFSVEQGGAEVFLDWDGGATATISGLLRLNGTTELWDVAYTITGISAVGTQGFEATGGSGTVTDPSNNINVLSGKQDGTGIAFRFLGDGHRIAGDSDTPVGRGWLEPPGSTDDWLVRAERYTPVPEPGTALLVGGGLAILAYSGRRRI